MARRFPVARSNAQEFVAPVARREIETGDEMRFEQRGDRLQHRVSGTVAEPVVHVFESVGIGIPDA